MNDQEIIDNAPEGATHIENNSNLYIKVLPRVNSTIFNDWFIFEIDQWIIIDTYNVLLMRSLADIKRIVELEKDNSKLEKEKERLTQHYDMWKGQWHELNNRMPVHNLEQQAKGVEGYIAMRKLAGGSYCSTTLMYIDELYEQAKALKDPK
jgi:hypothetical protein